MDEATAARAAIVVTECASNVWKHAGGGEILMSPLESEGPAGVEVLALDKGPGMNDVARCFQDGYSTAGSAGTGLGAIPRLSSQYDLHSVRDRGTALLARVWKGSRDRSKTPPHHLEIGGVSVPLRGEVVCGDGYAVHQEADFSSVMVVDGLGHGPDAAACADAAKEAFLETAREDPADILDALQRCSAGAARSGGGGGALRPSPAGDPILRHRKHRRAGVQQERFEAHGVAAGHRGPQQPQR